MKYFFERISFLNYAQYIAIVRNTRWGNLMLPDEYTSSLWGGVVKEGTQIIGGWVGLLRGNKPVVRLLAKSVYFDSYPFMISQYKNDECLLELMNAMREWAIQDNVVMFNLTHWSRGNDLPYLRKEKKATFVLPLLESGEAQWKLVESKQRNIVRKGEKNGVEIRILRGDDAINELPTLQLLKEQAYKHALQKNSKTQVLLKGNEFFENLLRHTDATLFIGIAQGKPASVALMIASGETVYYHSGGSDYELNRLVGSSAYLIWKAIEYYREIQGVKFMDLGGVPVKPDITHPSYGVYAFKRSFGGEYKEYDAGTIPISKYKYMLLKFVLKQDRLLRMISKFF